MYFKSIYGDLWDVVRNTQCTYSDPFFGRKGINNHGNKIVEVLSEIRYVNHYFSY